MQAEYQQRREDLMVKLGQGTAHPPKRSPSPAELGAAQPLMRQ